MKVRVKCISVSDMLSEMRRRVFSRQTGFGTGFVFSLCLLSLLPVVLSPSSCESIEIIDRVIAFVDEQAITLSEFREQKQNIIKIAPDITEEEVLNAMINKKLLIRDAKKYRIEAPSDEEIARDYIDLKVRAFIRIRESQTEEFYHQNISEFSGKNYDDVRDEIEEYLTEKEVNRRLKELVMELREKAYVKIQFKTE